MKTVKIVKQNCVWFRYKIRIKYRTFKTETQAKKFFKKQKKKDYGEPGFDKKYRETILIK